MTFAIIEGKLLSAADRSHDVHCHWRNMRYLAGESRYHPVKGMGLRPVHVRRDDRRHEVFEKTGVDDRRSWKIEVEEVGGKRGTKPFSDISRGSRRS